MEDVSAGRDAVTALADRVSALAGAEVDLERPNDPAHGDYATNVALRLAGARRLPPREIAGELAARVAELPEVERAEVAGPGFLNLWLDDGWFGEALAGIGPEYGAGSARVRERILVEL